jgi:hypothetical protein
MTNVYRFLFLCVTLGLGPTAVRADSVIVNTSLGLTELQILPGTGTLNVFSVTASTFAQALDSLGGFSQSSANPASAATTLANASGAASTSALTGSVTANIDLPDNFNGFASSEGDSVLSGMLEITSTTTSPINVAFNAFLTGNQLLETTGAGQFATSENTFTLSLTGPTSSNTILSYDNLLPIGPGSSLIAPYSSTLSTSLSLNPNTDYSFVASLDAESYGVSVTPEPSSLGLALALAGFLAVLGRLTKKPRLDGRG